MNLLAPFQNLPQGYYRLVIVLGGIFSLIVAFLFALGTNSDGEAFVLFIIGIFFGIAVYYLLARIGIWVYNGFNDQKPNL